MGLLDFFTGRKTEEGKDPGIRGGEPYIFVSYALADADEVYGIMRQLRDRGYLVW